VLLAIKYEAVSAFPFGIDIFLARDKLVRLFKMDRKKSENLNVRMELHIARNTGAI
jgi:hypothetical protein